MKKTKKIETSLKDRVLALLNEALALDPKAMTAMVNHRIPCNEAIADHASIQVRWLPVGPGNPRTKGDTTIGTLGLLNGLFPKGSRIAAVYNEAKDRTIAGPIIEFRLIQRKKATRTAATTVEE